jgi:hypothetical protein
MKNLYRGVRTKISKIILKIVCWHIFKAFLAKADFFNTLELVFFAIFTFESIGKNLLLIERWMLEASLPRL